MFADKGAGGSRSSLSGGPSAVTWQLYSVQCTALTVWTTLPPDLRIRVARRKVLRVRLASVESLNRTGGEPDCHPTIRTEHQSHVAWLGRVHPPVITTRAFSPGSLRKARRRLRWSQGKLGRIADVGRVTISRLENGVQNPHPNTVRDLADALRIPVSDLYAEVEQ